MNIETDLDTTIEMITKDVANIKKNSQELQTEALKTITNAINLFNVYTQADDPTVHDDELVKLKASLVNIRAQLVLSQGDIMMFKNTLLTTRDCLNFRSSLYASTKAFISSRLVTLEEQANTLTTGNNNLLDSFDRISKVINSL